VKTKFTAEEAYLRNNLRPDAGIAVFVAAEWVVLVAGVKDGDYGL
jgi:hypothetical protein